ncbi:MAG: hypothetical protein NTX57_10455 [Armatimonadetes bacterium]|nr:hypothetical protein [Armatimonadota bacterium]
MSTQIITRYFALLLAVLAGMGVVLMLTDIFSPGATPWNYLYLWVCLALLSVAQRIAAQRRWAIIVFTLFCAMGVQVCDLRAYLYLAHTIAGALLLILRWRELKPGL